MFNTITEMKNTLKGFNNRLDEAKERISQFKDKGLGLTQSSRKKKRMKER